MRFKRVRYFKKLKISNLIIINSKNNTRNKTLLDNGYCDNYNSFFLFSNWK